MSLLLHIGNDVQIIERSVRKHSTTADCNEEGQVLTSGGNRTLCSAVTTNGEIVVYAETNSDPVLLSKFDEFDFACLIGDNEDAGQGIERMRKLATELHYEDEVAEKWLTECIAIAEAELQRQQEGNDGDTVAESE